MECTHIVPWSFLHRNAEQCIHCNLPVRTNISAMTVTQDIPKIIYSRHWHCTHCNLFVFSCMARTNFTCTPGNNSDPRFSTTKKRLKMMQLVTLFNSYVYDGASTGIWVIHTDPKSGCKLVTLFHDIESDLAPVFHPLSALSLKESNLWG